jgi:deoxyhypusine synthase
LEYVRHLTLTKNMSLSQMLDEMKQCGVLGAGRIGKAAELMTEMFSNREYTVFLTLAGALVPGGLRKIIASLVEKGYVHVIVTTGANMVHDMVEALGYKHVIGTLQAEDKKLKKQEIGRIADIYIEQEAFKTLEKWLYKIIAEIPESERQNLATAELLFQIGKRIEDKESILATAAKKNVPIICPGFVDSIAGFQLWMIGQDQKIGINPLRDIGILLDKVYEAKKVGVIILGGGLPKHFALFANTFREGVDCAVQITMDRPEPGGLSGATLEEAISWGKLKPEGKAVTVICDATIAFPLIVAAALERL